MPRPPSPSAAECSGCPRNRIAEAHLVLKKRPMSGVQSKPDMSHFDYRFDDVRFRLGVRLEISDDIIERAAMCNPRIGGDAAGLDQVYDPREILRQRVPAAKQRPFRAVKNR